MPAHRPRHADDGDRIHEGRPMSTHDLVAILAASPLFAGVDHQELERICGEMEERQHAAGDRIVAEGVQGVEFFIVVEGDAVIEARGRQLAQLGPGDFFGEVSALDQGPRTATVRAGSALRSLALPDGALMGFLLEHPRVAVNMLYVSVRRFKAAMTSGRGAAQTTTEVGR
jgi:CRP-like cAMP-binding protein